MKLLRYLQGERPGMGSELIMPDRLGEKFAAVSLSPTIAIQEDVLIADVSFWQETIDFILMKCQRHRRRDHPCRPAHLAGQPVQDELGSRQGSRPAARLLLVL